MSDTYAHNKVNTMASNMYTVSLQCASEDMPYYGDTDGLISFIRNTLPTRMIDHSVRILYTNNILYPNNILCPNYMSNFEDDSDSDIPLLI